MTYNQKVFAILASVSVFLFILEMIRRRRLREDYAWLWLLTGFVMIILTLWYDLLVLITRFIGAVLPTTTLFLFGLLFLMMISVHYSIKISSLADQIKILAQELAILKKGKVG